MAQRWGYDVLASDANYYLTQGKKVPIPPVIRRHHPDLLGGRPLPPSLLIGEAKTTNDLKSSRTREQLSDYASVEGAVVVVAVPESCKTELVSVIRGLGLEGHLSLRCIPVPEELFPDD
ncbi:MAG: hypothetical protein KGJ69_15475 [Thermoplasmata archaeon]|nr:hypothetical protein [Thermoplasmata archaeon]